MELRQLRCFVAVAEELDFGRAAEKLLLGQPAMSQQIRRLERELRVELFDRSPRCARLTPAGERFLPAAREVLAAEDAARTLAAGLVTPGVLRLGTVTGLGDRLDLILDHCRRHAPGVRVELQSLPVQQRLARLADGRLDAAFVRGEPADDESGELRCLPLWQEELVIALPARLPLAGQPVVRLPELADLPLRITGRRNHPTLVDHVLTVCQSSGFTPTMGPAVGSLQDGLAAIGTGAPMWTVVYAANARMIRDRRIAFRPSEPALTVPTVLAVRRSAPLPRLLLDACRAAAAASRDDQDS